MNILKHFPSGLSKLHNQILPVKAIGSYIIDNKNRKYLDLTSGIGALSTGHSHNHVVKTVKSQIEKYIHLPQQLFQSHPIQIKFTEKLLTIMPSKVIDNVFYVNSGSEATDAAIKVARRYTEKTNIISFQKGFHGRTLGALSITSSNHACKFKSQPLIPGIFFCKDFTKESINELLEYQSSPDETAGIIIEPVQGEGGIHSVPKEFLNYLRKICDENNMLLICDEVQCGSGRTGSWWNCEQKDVIPDILTFGKGIASGYPLAGIASTSEIMNKPNKGFFGGTYGGNAIVCAAGSATIDIIKDENLLKNTIEIGSYIKKGLEKNKVIKEIRQYGLMIAFEFTFSKSNPELILEIISKLRELNILVLSCGNKNQYIRILPPLNLSINEADIFIINLNKILNKYYS